MSTVLWANRLDGGIVRSDQSDKDALYKHAARLDALCRTLGLPPFTELFDSTDLRFNLDDDAALPAGMQSTDEVMAREGVWIDAERAVLLFQGLLAHILQHRIRFGLLRNDHAAVVAELQEALAFAEEAATAGARFNLAIVM